MLVLIVVAAAIALAAFVASYQKQLQSQQAEAQQRNLESLKVLSVAHVTPEPTPNQLTLANFTFVLASEFVNPSTVTSVSVNGDPLRFFLVQNISPAVGTPQCFNDSTPFTLPAFQVVEITVNSSNVPLTPGTCPFAFFDTTTTVAVDSFLKLSLFTTLQNTFTQVFLPPTALPLVGTTSEFTGTGYRDVPVLDGSQSFQSGNGTLDQWSWSILNTSAGAPLPNPVNSLGEKLVAPFASVTSFGMPTTYTYAITLTVQNSNGLLDSATVTYSYVVP
jgi:hypothetical protein